MNEVGPFRAIDYVFTVEVDDPELASYLAVVLQDLMTDAEPTSRYLLLDRGSAVERRFEVHFDGDLVLGTAQADLPLAWLLAHVNIRAGESAASVVLHAAAAALDGDASLFAAASGIGKSTIATMLTSAGWEYLGDEAAAVDAPECVVRAYPKPISLHASITDHVPHIPVPVRPNGVAGARSGEQWRIPGSSIGSVATTARPLRTVVLLVRGPTTRLDPIRKADAILELVGHRLGPDAFDKGRFAAMADVVRGVDTARLTVRDPGEVPGVLGRRSVRKVTPRVV